ncbi:MAG TPA: hypothetical protein VM925_17670 [Labilithrix sp.]|nr:hypothetical protein [Labilithrix sp.]
MTAEGSPDHKHAVPWPKRCRGCGASYEEEAWKALPFVGIDYDYDLEFRNCGCGSTLAVPRVEP